MGRVLSAVGTGIMYTVALGVCIFIVVSYASIIVEGIVWLGPYRILGLALAAVAFLAVGSLKMPDTLRAFLGGVLLVVFIVLLARYF